MDDTLSDYLTQLASQAPTPGGGSAAALVAAAAAALVGMVARIDGSSPKYASHHALAEELVAAADAARMHLLAAGADDEAAYTQVVAAQALPKSTPSGVTARRDALERALQRAAAQPLASAACALDVLRLAERALEIPNPNLVSDLGCAASFANAAVTACAYNVRVNHRFMHDRNVIDAQSRELAHLERAADSLEASIRERVQTALAR